MEKYTLEELIEAKIAAPLTRIFQGSNVLEEGIWKALRDEIGYLEN